eukprot:scaffold53574_cov46-Phaeocystis_antarctica.AAC.3
MLRGVAGWSDLSWTLLWETSAGTFCATGSRHKGVRVTCALGLGLELGFRRPQAQGVGVGVEVRVGPGPGPGLGLGLGSATTTTTTCTMVGPTAMAPRAGRTSPAKRGWLLMRMGEYVGRSGLGLESNPKPESKP